MPIHHLSFVADIDECQTGGKTVCSPLERCINTAGSYECVNQTAAACKLGEQELDGRCIGWWNVLITSKQSNTRTKTNHIFFV